MQGTENLGVIKKRFPEKVDHFVLQKSGPRIVELINADTTVFSR